MTLEEKQSLLEEVELLINLDIEKDIHAFSDAPETQPKIIGEYSKLEFFLLYKRAFKQLYFEIDQGFGTLLPESLYVSSKESEISLLAITNQIRSLLEDNDLLSIVEFLKKIITYQVCLGFWDKSAVKNHDIDSIKVEELAYKCKLLTEQLNIDIKKNDKLLNSLATIKAEYAELSEQVAQKEITIESNEIKVVALIDTATDSLARAQSTVEQIEAIRVNQNNLFDSTKNTFTERNSEFRQLNTNSANLLVTLEDEKTRLEKVWTEASSNLESALILKNEIESKKGYITELIGFAADGSLGYKFEQRRKKLEISALIWGIAVGVVSIFSIAWAFCVFYYFSHQSNNEYITFLVNSLKTAPVFFMLGFTINQYRKERNLQEEYAFKSAVAMTLTAYSEMLNNGDIEANKSKIEMLQKSIQMVYTQPRIHTESTRPFFSFHSKDVASSLQAIVDGLKSKSL